MADPTPAPDRPSRSLGLLINSIRGELVHALETALQREGVDLRFTQLLALRHLAMDGPMGAGELARALDHDAGAMTRVIDHLVARGYVHRQPDARDRRSLRIAATDAGLDAWHRIARIHGDTLERAQQSLSASERSQLLALLERLHASLQTLQ